MILLSRLSVEKTLTSSDRKICRPSGCIRIQLFCLLTRIFVEIANNSCCFAFAVPIQREIGIGLKARNKAAAN